MKNPPFRQLVPSLRAWTLFFLRVAEHLPNGHLGCSGGQLKTFFPNCRKSTSSYLSVLKKRGIITQELCANRYSHQPCSKKGLKMLYYCQRTETIFFCIAYGKAGNRKNKVDRGGPTFGRQPRRTAEEVGLKTQETETQERKIISLSPCRFILKVMMLRCMSSEDGKSKSGRE